MNGRYSNATRSPRMGTSPDIKDYKHHTKVTVNQSKSLARGYDSPCTTWRIHMQQSTETEDVV